MSEYPKIATLFERDEKTFIVDPTKLKRPVFGTISEWDVTEKVDGMNMRVVYHPGHDGHVGLPDNLDPEPPSVRFYGRSDAAQIPGDLLAYMTKTFTPQLMLFHFQTPVVLYGEGYGAGIQKAGRLYRPDKSFILFDVLVDGTWWLNTKAMRDVAAALGIDAVPYFGRWPLQAIINEVRAGKGSLVPGCNALSEGIVARPIETLFDSRKERVILKLKTKDFVAGKI